MGPRGLRTAIDPRAQVTAVPALVMIGVFIALAAAQGGYFESSFLPAALFTLLLLAVSLASIATGAEVPRAVMVAVGLIAAYAGWSYLSILWADHDGAALEGANRALLYALVFALCALWPMRPAGAAAVVTAFGIGVAALGLITLLRAGTASDVSAFFVSGRFGEPVGYTNGNVALWFMGLLPCLFAAGRRELPVAVRGLALGGAGLLAGLALLGQSRGWLVALPVTLVLLLAIVPGRARMLVAVGLVAGGVLAVLGPILGVFQGFSEGRDLEPLMAAAVRSILVMAAVLTLVGSAAALADRRVNLTPTAATGARRGTGAVAAAAVAVGLLLALVSVGDPIGRASQAVQEFTAGSDAAGQPLGASRFTTASGQNRFDFWSVGLSEFAERPLAGKGTGGFQTAYVQEGQTSQRPRFAHSLEVRLLFETGIVGSIIFLFGVAAALVAAAKAIRRSPPLGAAAAGSAVVVFLYWVVHGSVDWFYELPALGAPAFAMLGLAAGLAPRRSVPRSRQLAAGVPRLAALAVAVIVGLVVLGAPWLAARNVDIAVAAWPRDPTAALDRLDRAAALNPLSTEPQSAAAAIALQLGELELARHYFESLLRRDPANPYATLQLAALASAADDRDRALELLRRAAELSPRDGLIEDGLERVEDGERLDPREIYQQAAERRNALTDRPDAPGAP